MKKQRLSNQLIENELISTYAELEYYDENGDIDYMDYDD